MFFTPSTLLTTFSSGLMTSFSIASGEAPGIGHRHVRLRDGDFRHLLDRQQPVREHAEHHQREHDHRREDGLIDAGASDPHKEVTGDYGLGTSQIQVNCWPQLRC